MVRTRRKAVAAALAVIVSLATGIAAASTNVGPPPSFDHRRCLPPERPCGDPFVIAAGRDAHGRVELVGMRVNWGGCVAVERRDESGGYCGQQLAPVDRAPLHVSSWGIDDKPTATEVAGAVRGDVRRVQVRYSKNGKAKQESATLGTPNRRQLRELDQSKRFGFFALSFRGCVAYDQVTVVARNRSGRVLGRQTGSDFMLPDCAT